MFGQMPRWKLFTIRGHDVFMSPLFLFLIAFFVFSDLNSASEFSTKLLWAPILFFGVLWHELGHAATIKAFGYGPSKIIFQGLGGVTVNRARGNAPPGRSILISLAGPLASLSLTLIFGVAAYFYPERGDLLYKFLYLMAVVNGIWAIFNLLPINPLDGGHIVLHGLRKVLKDNRKAMLYSAYSSLVVLGVAVLLSFVFQVFGFLLVILALLFAMQNYQTIKQLKAARQ